MTSQLKQIQPERVIAQFGKRDNPLFLVNEAGLVTDEEEPASEAIADADFFMIRDADQGLSEAERRLAVGEFEHIDPDAGKAELQFRLLSAGEAAYQLSPADIVSSIGVVAQRDQLRDIKLTDTNLPSYVLEKVVGPAELPQASSEPFEFKIAA